MLKHIGISILMACIASTSTRAMSISEIRAAGYAAGMEAELIQRYDDAPQVNDATQRKFLRALGENKRVFEDGVDDARAKWFDIKNVKAFCAANIKMMKAIGLID